MLERVLADVESFESQIAELGSRKQTLMEELAELDRKHAEILPVHAYAKALADDMAADEKKRVAKAKKTTKSSDEAEKNAAAE